MSIDILGPTWNLTPNGVEIVNEASTIKDKCKILQNALDTDLKDIGSAVLNKFQGKSTSGDVVLQIQKIRNISAPKANEKSQAAPRMLKLVLTDGDSYIQAIEISPIASISAEKTAPGTKILIKNAKICSGYLLLTQQNCALLGGKVPALYEKWEVAKSIMGHKRQVQSIDGPPAWVNFGTKISNVTADSEFQSLVNKEAKENTDFDLQREEAIAEAAASGAVKKVFGGGAKQTVQSTIRNAQNYKRNNNPRGGKDKWIDNLDEVEEKPSKPTEKVSLFAFLEDKIPDKPQESVDNVKSTQNQYDSRHGRNYNNYNRDFNKYEDRNTYQSGRNYNNYNRSDQNKKSLESSQHSQPQQQYNRNYNRQNRYENRRNDSEPAKRNDTEIAKSANTETFKKNEVEHLTNKLDKVSINPQFASRSLKQYLDLDKKREVHTEWKWKVGDECLAKYWEDGKYYDASITAVTDKTCVVKFRGYDNIEEVLKAHCLPVEKEPPRNEPRRFNNARTFNRRQ